MAQRAQCSYRNGVGGGAKQWSDSHPPAPAPLQWDRDAAGVS